jgi:hypothetical protein
MHSCLTGVGSAGKESIMKRYGFLLVAIQLSVAGCMSPRGTPDYTATGALAGGAAGVIIGSMSHNPRAGVVVGGAVGTVVGSIIGHSLDEAQEARLRAQEPQTLRRLEQGAPLTVEDIKALVMADISDELILSQIKNSQTVFQLSADQVIDLKNCGVSDAVIKFMINTPNQVSTIRVQGAPQCAPAPWVEPVLACPGPGFIWIPGAWFWISDGWQWRAGYWHRPDSRRSRHR